jgi:catechol 2,3-dioxygenase-like lactoylglutathione lyase family enzyme
VIRGYDHVQVALPPSSEATARRFYGDVLGMSELAKPVALAGRGGCWFASGSAVLHLGVEMPFHPARKAHPAFLVDDLDALAARLADTGCECVPSHDEIPGVHRFHTFDPFGNRLEFRQA